MVRWPQDTLYSASSGTIEQEQQKQKNGKAAVLVIYALKGEYVKLKSHIIVVFLVT